MYQDTHPKSMPDNSHENKPTWDHTSGEPMVVPASPPTQNWDQPAPSTAANTQGNWGLGPNDVHQQHQKQDWNQSQTQDWNANPSVDKTWSQRSGMSPSSATENMKASEDHHEHKDHRHVEPKSGPGTTDEMVNKNEKIKRPHLVEAEHKKVEVADQNYEIQYVYFVFFFAYLF